MNEKPENPEMTPFEKFRAMAAQVVAVPKSEVLKREAEWKKQKLEGRKSAKTQKNKSEDPGS